MRQRYYMSQNEDGTYFYQNQKKETFERVAYDNLPAYFKKRAIAMAWGFSGGTCVMHTGKVINDETNRITGATRTVYADSGRVVQR